LFEMWRHEIARVCVTARTTPVDESIF